jgi:V/A-type H+-transporting ATPase subunit I
LCVWSGTTGVATFGWRRVGSGALGPGSRSHGSTLGLLGLLSAAAQATHPDPAYDAALARPTEALLAEANQLVDDIGPSLQGLALRRDELAAEATSLPRYAATIRQVIPLAVELPDLEAYETVALLIERPFSAVLETISQELTALVGDLFELTARDLDDQTTAAVLVFPKAQSAKVHGLLGREHIGQVRLPRELAHVSFKEALATIEARMATIPREIESIRTRLGDLTARWHHPLALLRAVLRDRLQELDVVARFGATQYTFVIVGWIPRRLLSDLREALARQVGPQVMLGELSLSPEELERAPVLLSNPALARPFEFLVQLLALPKYGTLDPTPLLALFLPIFFGMILGDIAYGALVLLIALYMRHRFSAGVLHNLAEVLIFCGLWAVIFGVLFGELLGSLGHQAFGIHPLWMERRGAALPMLLIFSLAVGVVHVVLGAALGVWEALHRRSGKLFSERLGKLIALVAIFWLVGVTAQYLPAALLTPGIVLLMIGIVLLGTPLGWAGILLGPLEVLGGVGNILSYLRLAALGLSSVYLAEVANQLYGALGGAFLGAIVAGLFHALNLALGLTSPTIQALRLHYVEFFPRFYEGGGEAFKPFKPGGMS